MLEHTLQVLPDVVEVGQPVLPLVDRYFVSCSVVAMAIFLMERTNKRVLASRAAYDPSLGDLRRSARSRALLLARTIGLTLSPCVRSVPHFSKKLASLACSIPHALMRTHRLRGKYERCKEKESRKEDAADDGVQVAFQWR